VEAAGKRIPATSGLYFAGGAGVAWHLGTSRLERRRSLLDSAPASLSASRYALGFDIGWPRSCSRGSDRGDDATALRLTPRRRRPRRRVSDVMSGIDRARRLREDGHTRPRK